MVHEHTRIYGVIYCYGGGLLLRLLLNIKRKAIKLEFKWAPKIRKEELSMHGLILKYFW